MRKKEDLEVVTLSEEKQTKDKYYRTSNVETKSNHRKMKEGKLSGTKGRKMVIMGWGNGVEIPYWGK